MIILVTRASDTYRAQIRSSVATGFKKLYSASCTMGEEQAAKAVVRKWFSDAHADTVRQLTDRAEIAALVGDAMPNSAPTYWAFDERKPSAKKAPPSSLPPSPTCLPPLGTVAASLGGARDRLDEMARTFDRDSLADRLWIGVCCLAARERHALSDSERAATGGRGKAAKSRRDLAEISPDQAHPGGFLGWLESNCPWLQKPTAYKYMDAATGAGLTAWDDLDRVRQWTSEAIAKHDQLSLAQLVREGRSLPAPAPKAPAPTRWEQMTFDSLLGFRAQAEQIISCVPHMSTEQHTIACARAYDTLKRLTGSPWQPSDQDVPDYLAVLGEVAEGGL